jgi:hypothetical protein
MLPIVTEPSDALSGESPQSPLGLELVETRPTEMINDGLEESSAADSDSTNNKASPAELADRAGWTYRDRSPEYNTCFGVVSIDISRTGSRYSNTSQVLVQSTLSESFKSLSNPEDALLDVRATNSTIRLYKENDEFVGLLISSGLGLLLEKFSVHLTATFAPEPPKGAEGLTRIVIYGLVTDKDAIGKHLSSAGLYLQHPKLSEYDQSMEYFNPQLLLRPGANMPRVEDLNMNAEDESSPSPTTLDEASKGRILRVFDLANSGGAVAPEVTPSPRLKSTLTA